MMISILLKSLFLGFAFTLPIGPIGVLCVRKIFQYGPIYGFILGLSQVFISFVYSIIAVLSIAWFSEFITKYEHLIQLIGGVVLIGAGIMIFLYQGRGIAKGKISKDRFIADFLSITGLMLLSLPTLAIFLAFFAALKLYQAATLFQHIGIILSILIGSIVSWGLVCACIAAYKKPITQKAMTWINRAAGVVLLGLGVVICITAY
jgi:threonine/homoserine/homoserine lactone efflux protein